MDATLTINPTTTRTVRAATSITCPGCGHVGTTRATTVKCGGCGLRAPVSAFSGAVATRKFGAPRAFTIGGRVD